MTTGASAICCRAICSPKAIASPRRTMRPKPFEPRELSLRIASILKRAVPAPPPAIESARFGDFVFHLARGELRRGEETIRLTDRERDMLRVLAAAPGETVPRMALAGNGGGVNER